MGCIGPVSARLVSEPLLGEHYENQAVEAYL